MSATEDKGLRPRDSKCRKKSLPPAIPRSTRAGLVFPMGRCHRHMMNVVQGKYQIGSTAATYATATIEYLTAEMMLLSGNLCKAQKSSRISPCHLHKMIKDDEELKTLMDDTIKVTGNDLWKLLAPDNEVEQTPTTDRVLPRRSPRIKPKRKPPPKRK